jgi:hypothetical protein
MNRKKIVGFAFVIIIISISVYVYSEYNRKAKGLVSAVPDFEVSDTILVSQFLSNEELSNKRYFDKVILVTGTVKSIDKTNSQTIINLGNSVDLSSVKCQLDSTQVLSAIVNGSTVSLKGLFIGFNKDTLIGSDVTLNRCVLINEK